MALVCLGEGGYNLAMSEEETVEAKRQAKAILLNQGFRPSPETAYVATAMEVQARHDIRSPFQDFPITGFDYIRWQKRTPKKTIVGLGCSGDFPNIDNHYVVHASDATMIFVKLQRFLQDIGTQDVMQFFQQVYITTGREGGGATHPARPPIRLHAIDPEITN